MQIEPNFLGFTSLTDFVDSFFRFATWGINSIGALGATITTFVTGYMWDSESAVYTLWLLMGVDWLTGVIKAVKNKEFVSNKIFRMPLYFVVTSFIIGISWWMAKGNILFKPLPAIAMGGFYAVYFTSLLENLGEINLLPKQMIKILNKIGLKAIHDKYFKKDE